MSESELFVNDIIESQDTPNNWQESLRELNTPSLLNEYNAALVWVASNNNLDNPIQLSETEQMRLKDVITTLQEETAKRAKDITNKSQIDAEQYLNLMHLKGLIDKEELQQAHQKSFIADYIILSQETAFQEEKEYSKNKKIDIKKAYKNMVIKFGIAPAIALLAACSDTSPTPPASPTRVEQTTLPASPTATEIVPTVTPSIVETPTPQNTFRSFEQNLQATAQAVPEKQNTTLKSGEVFYRGRHK